MSKFDTAGSGRPLGSLAGLSVRLMYGSVIFLYQREQVIAVSELAGLVEKLEFIKNVLHVMAKSEQVFCEVI